MSTLNQFIEWVRDTDLSTVFVMLFTTPQVLSSRRMAMSALSSGGTTSLPTGTIRLSRMQSNSSALCSGEDQSKNLDIRL